MTKDPTVVGAYETFEHCAARVLFKRAQRMSYKRWTQCTSLNFSMAPIDDPKEPAYWVRESARYVEKQLKRRTQSKP